MSVGFDVFFVKAFLAFLGKFFRALHQHFFGFHKFLSPKTKIAGVGSGIHTDGIARTRLYTVTTVDTPERVDLIPDWKFFNRIVRILARFDIDTLRRASRRAKKAGSALDRPVFLERQPMASTIGIWVG